MARICGNCKSSDIKQIGAIRAQLSQDNSSTTLGIGLLSEEFSTNAVRF